ncbi:MAG: hypothetical protein ACOYJE_00145 [Bacteroidaceae bacterium]|jgi:hypothetical protein
MRRARKTFQARVVSYGRALPVVLFFMLGSWVVSLSVDVPAPAHMGSFLWEEFNLFLPGERRISLAIGLLLYLGIGFSLIPLNNQLVVIRTRASMQTIFFFFWLALLPFLHPLLYDACPMFLLLCSLSFLMLGYQRERPMGFVYHALLCLGLASCFAPELLLLLPVYIVGACLFRMCSWRNLLAGILGVLFAYVFFTGIAWAVGKPELLFLQFASSWEQMQHYVRPDYALWFLVLVGYQLVLLLCTIPYYWLKRPKIGLRTRDFLAFFLLLELAFVAGMCLKPELLCTLLPLSLICLSFIEGHFFSFVYTKSSNVLFAFALSVPFVLYLILLLS